MCVAYKTVCYPPCRRRQLDVSAQRHRREPAPCRKARALAFVELAAAHDGPPRVAGEHAAAGLDLVIEVDRPDELAEPVQDSNLPFEPARVDVPPVTRDVPAAGEHQPRARCRQVEHRLSGPRRVAVDTPGDQHGEDPAALRYRLPDDLAVVGRPGYDGDAPGERIEFGGALLTAHADHLIAPVKRMLHHVLPELPGGSHDADPHHTYLSPRTPAGDASWCYYDRTPGRPEP